MKKDADTLARQDSTPIWVQNEHGVKSCFPKKVAMKLVKKNYGWEFAEPDEVPVKKQYPLGMGALTELGQTRRASAQKSTEDAESRAFEEVAKENSNLSWDDLKTKAKRAGIDRYWLKSKERLLKEIEKNKLENDA